MEKTGVHIDCAGPTPWYDKNNTLGRTCFRPASTAFTNAYPLYYHDSPSIPVVNDQYIGTNCEIKSFSLIVDFRLYLAVHTTEQENQADKHYTQRAAAFWRFDGSGPISVGRVWSQGGSGTTGSSKFLEVFSGEDVPDTAGLPMNYIGDPQNFTWQVR